MSETPDGRDSGDTGFGFSDTRDPEPDGAAAATPQPLLSDRGEGAELRVFLEEVLQIPRNNRKFSVTFEMGEPVIVSVEFLPREH